MRVLSAETPAAAIREYEAMRRNGLLADDQRYGLALARLLSGDYAVAATRFAELLEEYPGDLWLGVSLAEAEGRYVTTIEGLSPNGEHKLQKAWVAEQVPQCGYCQSGQFMQAAALLATKKNPTREEIVAHMDGNICRCGTYQRIVKAIQRAAKEA